MSRKKITTEQWIQNAKEIHGDKYDYSKVVYKKSSEKVCIICPKHGEFWQIANNHLRGSGCLKCKTEQLAKSQKGNITSFIEKANEIHNFRYNYSKSVYGKNNKEKIIIICPKHGEFMQSPHDHLSGYGCPKCQLKSQTKLYENLKKQFPNEEIIFEATKNIIPWIENQRIDIYFPKYNIAIEYNGEQHYIPIEHFGGIIELQDTQIRDEIKRIKCKENNCTLFELKYDYSKQDFDNLIININNIISNYEH